MTSWVGGALTVVMSRSKKDTRSDKKSFAALGDEDEGNAGTGVPPRPRSALSNRSMMSNKSKEKKVMKALLDSRLPLRSHNPSTSSTSKLAQIARVGQRIRDSRFAEDEDESWHTLFNETNCVRWIVGTVQTAPVRLVMSLGMTTRALMRTVVTPSATTIGVSCKKGAATHSSTPVYIEQISRCWI